MQLYARALGKRCFEAARPRITQLLASSELLLAIRNFGGKATPLAKQLARDLRKTKMMTEGMLKFLIKEGLFKGFNSISVAAGDVAIGVLAVILQVTFGLRASNSDVELVSGGLRQVGSARRPDEHVLLARNVNFYCKLTARMLGDNPKLKNLTVTDNEKDDGFKWLDGFELSKYYRSNRPVRDLEVTDITVRISTSKNNRDGLRHTEYSIHSEDCVEHRELIVYMVGAAVRGAYDDPSDPFLSRRNAEECHFSLDGRYHAEMDTAGTNILLKTTLKLGHKWNAIKIIFATLKIKVEM